MSLFAELSPPYSTIVADPPWHYDEGFPTQSRSPSRGWSAAVETKALPYSGMSVDDICDLPVATLAAGACRLFLWTTNRYLPDSFRVMEAWGFRYRQMLVWHKRDGNMGGSVAPCSAEFLLVGVLGAPPVLAKWGTAVLSAPQSKTHSKKPAAFLDLVETVSPGPYVELFARAPRLGWDSWGKGYELSGAA